MSSSSSSSVFGQKYDVFLSFRGEDTRNNFTDHLYAALKRKGIVTFKDDRNLKPGEEIKPELLEAIQESWCSIIVFSKTYAFSTWCLEELAVIVQQKKAREHKIFPIFYYVDPSDLGKQTGEVDEAFSKHEERYKENKDKIQRWRDALTEVTKITGWHLVNKPESEFVEGIVQKIYSVVPCDLIKLQSSKDFMSSKSSTLTFNQIIKALNTNGVNMIGLYGMPGVGKTTLAKEVVKHVKEQKLFDNAVMVTMSQTPDINKIQDRIAESLHLKFEATTKEGKAEKLWWTLKDVNKIFIIIDDVWNEFDLRTIGIPFGVEHEGCKILLTMRLERVCVQMNCQKKFQLNLLSKDEAWALFKAIADLKDVSSTLNDVAKEVASECNGLPLAVVAVGKALKGESLDGWIAANKRFKDSRHSDNEDVCKEVYRSLHLSYDYLKGDNIRSCFLLCSLFPEDRRINTELLIMFAIGQGLFFDIELLNDLRREICEAIKKLHESGLLLKIDEDDDDDKDDDDDDDEINVRMHDVVRDFAQWISSREKNIFMVKEGLTEWPKRESFGCYTAICFWKNQINNFPENLKFSKLNKIFLFEKRYLLVRFSNAFFVAIKGLRVLYLKNVIFSLKALQFLRNLRTLWFVDCKLENLSSLSNMENLEILAMINTDIYELPEELVALRRLRSVVFNCEIRKEINFPPNLLSRLTSLQELDVRCRNNLNLLELNSLSRLTTLSLFVSTQSLPENLVFPKLQKYIISVNGDPLFQKVPTSLRSLTIFRFSSSLSAFQELFCNVKKLNLWEVREHKNIVPSVDREGLNELTSLQVQFCNDMEYLMDTTREIRQTKAFSNLLKLHVEGMSCLKELCHGPPSMRFLQKLKHVAIDYCKELQVLFQMDGVLEQEEISGLMPLFSNLTSLQLSSLPELESIWKLQPTHQYHINLRSLKNVRIENCMKLKSIFSTCIAQSLFHLQHLTVNKCHGLKQVFDFPPTVGKLEKNQTPPLSSLTWLKLSSLPELKSIWNLQPTHQYHVSLRSLENVRIENCIKLKSIFSTCVAQSLSHLQHLAVNNCDELEKVFDFPQKMGELEKNQTPPLSNLTWLELLSLPELKSIWKLKPTHQYHVSLQSLKDVKIVGCHKLKSIFSACIAQSLLHLQELDIYDCDRLEQIFNFPQEVGELKTGPISNLTRLELSSLPELESTWKLRPTHQYHVSLRSLKNVRIENCMKLKSIFSTCVARSLLHLQHLTVNKCNRLKQVFDFPQKVGELETPPLSNLARLQLSSLPELDSIWKVEPTHQYHVSLRNLKEVTIEKCMRLKSIFSTCISQSLSHLRQLKISNCDGLEQVFYFSQKVSELEEDQISPLSNLTYLILNSLPKLRCIWKRPTHVANPQSLKTLTITRCSELAYLFPSPLAQSLVNLEVLWVKNCESLEHVIVEEAAENEDQIVSNVDDYSLYWPKLNTLQIIGCRSLKYVFPMALAQGLPYLESIEIADCSQLQQVFKMTTEKGGHPQQDIVLQRIRILKLQNLENLSSFCPVNFVMPLWVKGFKVSNCPRLTCFENWQGVLVRAEYENVPLYDDFKRLLCNAKKLSMYQVDYDQNLIPYERPRELNKLNFLTLMDKELECLIDTTDQGLVSTGAFFNLVELRIEKMTGLKKLCNGPFPKGFLLNLEELEICGCKELISLTPVLQNLKKVKVINCGQLQQVFHTDALEENRASLMSNLTSLELRSLPELKWIWKGPCHYVNLQILNIVEIGGCDRLKYLFSQSLAQSLVLLERLKIECCNRLEHLITTEPDGGHVHPPLFPKLTSLEIDSCERLEYVFKIDLDKGLPHLTSLSIINASQLKQVFINVAKQKNVVDHAFVLPRLQHLRLHKLKILSCFYSENHPIVSPSSEKLTVDVSSQLKTFAIQQGNREVQLKIEDGHFLSRIEVLELKSIHQLQGPIQVASLRNLRNLVVINCNRLKYLFSSALARNLLQLKIMRIKFCEELEEVIEMDQTSKASSSHGHLQPISFPSLKDIWIDGCSNLKSLFPISVIPYLSNLNSLRIKGVSKLEQVFGYQLGEPNVEHYQKEIVFPELLNFKLSKLPSLKTLAPMGYNFCYPSLRSFEVTECPTLTTSSSMDPKHSDHAITKALKNGCTCNFIIWFSQGGPKPLYVTVGETKIIIREEGSEKF